MPNTFLRYIHLICLCIVMQMAHAYDFEAGGLYYSFHNSNQVKVSGCDKNKTGSLVIPKTVTFNGETYQVTSIAFGAFVNCTSLTSITIPNSVTTIGNYAFQLCSNLTSVSIPNSVTAIEAETFSGCTSLTSITIPNSVTAIKGSAFYGCSGLTSVTIPNSVTAIGYQAFYGCSGLTSITIPNSVTSIGNYAFSECFGLTSVAIGNSITSIGYAVFYNCSGLTSITIPNSVTVIEAEAFDGCTSLTSVTIGNFVMSIGNFAFCDCKGLTSVIIPNSVTAIGESAFYGCSSLTSVTIPNSVTAIGRGAFYKCNGLTSVTIPNSVTAIGNSAFGQCNSLKSVCTKITNPFTVNCFDNTSNATLIVPKGTKNKYENLSGWNGFKEIKEEGVNNYSISITANGNGSASYNNTMIQDETRSFTIEEGSSATVLVTPDVGYRIASVKLNDKDVTSDVANSQYTISNITANANIDVTFEPTPVPITPLYQTTLKQTWEKLSYHGIDVYDLGWDYVPNKNGRYYDENSKSIRQQQTNDTDIKYSFNYLGELYALEGLVWDQIPDYSGNRYGDEEGWAEDIYTSCKDSRIHIWDSPQEALADPDGAAIKIYCDPGGWDLKPYLGLHCLRKDSESEFSSYFPYRISRVSASDLGLHYEFEFVDYCSSINRTYESRYAKFSDWNVEQWNKKPSKSGILIPQGVDENGKTTDYFSTGIDGHEPLVRVMLKDESGNVLLDGYILVRIISNSYKVNTGSTNRAIDNIPILETNHVSGYSITLSSTWSQFSYLILQKGLNGMPISVFDEYYRAECKSGGTVSNNDINYVTSNAREMLLEGTHGYQLKLYNFGTDIYGNDGTPPIQGSANAEISNSLENKELGTAIYFPHGGGTNHTFAWTLSDDEIKYLSKGKASPFTVSRWFCYGAKNSMAPYPNIWVKMTMKISTKQEPVKTFLLNISSTGNGSVTYDNTAVRNNTRSFTIDEGTSATVLITPGVGYRIASVKSNDKDVTASVANNQYTISNITANTKLDVVFEAIPPTTYTLSITSSGNGSVTYDNIAVRNGSRSFTINEGTSAKILFASDEGYRIKSVKVNNAAVTVTNNQNTINNISANTTVYVEFEAIPPTTYTLSITSSGNGSVTYDNTAVRNNTRSFTINEGTSAAVSISPDNGYRIASVKLNGKDVTSAVTDSRYNIGDITDDTNLSVTFEAIPIVTYTLSIKSTGNGSASYDGTTIQGTASSFTVNEGTDATIVFTPNEGYQIKDVKVDDAVVVVVNNQYTIRNITKDTSVEVIFEEIPQVKPEPATYTLMIKATGNGAASFDDTTVKAETATFIVNEGSTVILSFSPDNGNSVSVVMLNGKDITDKAMNNRVVIDEITQDISFEVVFKEDINALTVDGINYKVVSQSEKTVMLVGGDYGQVLTIPATVSQDGTTWKVTGIEKDALKGIVALCAVIWEPEALFTADVSNPNLLLYVKDSQYAPADIKNVVVNGSATSITLVDANGGNSFFCPQAFSAQKISYTHHYGMITGIGESRGWETIALPFDVQTVTHAVKGTCRPFANWKSGDDARPFWLYELTGSGFAEAAGIEAYTPYVISMPNHPRYEEKWILRGNLTFAATNTVVKKTEDVKTVTYGDRTFVPCFADMAADAGFYALNVNNDLSTNTNGMTEGSRFVLNMRKIHPFEAYMISTSNASRWYFDIFEGMTTAIKDIEKELFKDEQIYDLQGRKTQKPHKKGIYVTDGKKLIVR